MTDLEVNAKLSTSISTHNTKRIGLTIDMNGRINQRKIEWANGIIKHRIQVMKEFTNYSSARYIMEGNDVFYNFIRKNRSKGLKGFIPREVRKKATSRQ